MHLNMQKERTPSLIPCMHAYFHSTHRHCARNQNEEEGRAAAGGRERQEKEQEEIDSCALLCLEPLGKQAVEQEGDSRISISK